MCNTTPRTSIKTMSTVSLEKQTMTLARLLSQRQWSILEALATSPTGSASIPVDDPSLPHAITPDIVLHFAARFQAPLRILSLLSRMHPVSITSSDITGRYPIHVAAKWGATPDVIAYLIKTNPSVTGLPDNTGKTPMHYVGEYYLQNFNSQLYGRDDSMLQVVRLLKNAAPHSVNLEDNEGMNAIEYALDSDANLRVVKTMQRACRDDWRERSKSAANIMAEDDEEDANKAETPPVKLVGRRRHDDLVKDMETMALKLQKQYSSKGLDAAVHHKLPNERIHVKTRTGSPKTQVAARTA